jgi:Glycosyl transferase family 2/Glycosyl transferase 4-like domain
MSTRRSICFVTFEVGPFTAGGIGTFMRNTLATYAGRGTDMHVLVVGVHKIDPLAFDTLFPGVGLTLLDPETYLERDPTDAALPRSMMESRFQWYSHIAMRQLRRMERAGQRFDVIEFPDWGGYGFYSIQEKLLGRAFQNTTLAVRLHATESILRHYETRPWGLENLILADLERKALADADLIVGHLDSTADEYQSRYGFSAQWRRGVVVGLPPVLVSTSRDTTTIPDPATTPILFTSKLQSIKRPETFVQGVCAFASANPAYDGDIIITAFDFDQTYGQAIRDLVPKALRKRVRFVAGMPKEAREQLIARSVVVLPNAFEAFCFAAYEASRLGAVVVLNAQNVSFGSGTPWIDNRNCAKFDGTATNLAHVLSQLFFGEHRSTLEPVTVAHAIPPYWEHIMPRPTASRVAPADPAAPVVSIIIPHCDQPVALRQTVLDLLEEHSVPLEIIVVDDASETAHASVVLDALERLHADGHAPMLQIKRAASKLGTAASCNRAFSQARGRYSLLIYPGSSLKPDFLATACAALDKEDAFDFVIPTAAVTGPRDDGAPTVGLFMPLGEALGLGLHVNRSCLHTLFARTSRLRRLGFDEQMGSEIEWELCMRAALDGSRFIVSTDIDAYVPQHTANRLTWHNETQRRANAEVVRRSASAVTVGGAVPLHAFGDAELLAAEWFILPSRGGAVTGSDASAGSMAHQNQIASERDEWRRRYEELRGAESVRIALALANGARRFAPAQLTRLGAIFNRISTGKRAP